MRGGTRRCKWGPWWVDTSEQKERLSGQPGASAAGRQPAAQQGDPARRPRPEGGSCPRLWSDLHSSSTAPFATSFSAPPFHHGSDPKGPPDKYPTCSAPSQGLLPGSPAGCLVERTEAMVSSTDAHASAPLPKVPSPHIGNSSARTTPSSCSVLHKTLRLSG